MKFQSINSDLFKKAQIEEKSEIMGGVVNGMTIETTQTQCECTDACDCSDCSDSNTCIEDDNCQ